MLQSNFIEAGSTEATEKLSPRAISAQIPEHGIVVTEIRHPPGRTDLPKEDFARFLLILSGNARLQGRERRYVAGPETLFHIPAGLAIHQEIPPNNDILGCVLRYKSGVISPSLAQQLFSLEMVQLDLGAATVSQARGVQAIFREMLFEQDTRHDGWEMILLSRLIEVAVRVVRLKRRKPNKLPGLFEPGSDSTERVARYAARLKTQFFRQETLNDAARSVGLGCRQFSELFRKLTGESWRQHVLGLRLKHAMGLLLDTDRSISAVAFESGFDDLSNFHHIFKTTHGCSPLAYRKQRRIKLPSKSASFADDGNGRHGVSDGFQFRGIKGWCWTPEQYLQEIPVLAGLKMNFLMNCYRSMSVSPPGEPWCNEWWRPLNKERKKKFTDIIHSCQLHGISFCLAMHPQLASPRPLLHGDRKDLDAFYKHYEWAQNEGVK